MPAGGVFLKRGTGELFRFPVLAIQREASCIEPETFSMKHTSGRSLHLDNVKTKKPSDLSEGFCLKSATTYSPTNAVPSALAGLTSLFGMGRGGTPSL